MVLWFYPALDQISVLFENQKSGEDKGLFGSRKFTTTPQNFRHEYFEVPGILSRLSSGNHYNLLGIAREAKNPNRGMFYRFLLH